MKSPKARAPSFAALSLVMTLLACQLEVPVRPSFTAISQPAPNTNHAMLGLQQAGLALSENDEAKRAQASKVYSRMPIGFEVNCGQTDSRVKFLSRGAGYTLFLTSTEAVMMLKSEEAGITGQEANGRSQKSGVRSQNELALAIEHRSISADHQPPSTASLRMKLTGSNSEPVIEGIDPLPGRSNYITGNDSGKWQRNVAQFAGVKYANIYPGVDLIYHGDQGEMEYDFVLSPGADPKTVNLSFEGAQRMRIASDGDLVLKTEQGEIRQRRPVAYQEVDGERKPVDCRFTISAHSEVGFELGEYDATRHLIIDPVLTYATYLGESDPEAVFSSSSRFDFKIDSSGNVYVVGLTESADFPTTKGAFQRAHGGNIDVVVTKLDATGVAVYSSYLGGGGGEDLLTKFAVSSLAFAIDESGNIYLTGGTDSPDFPTTQGAFQSTFGGKSDAFITKLDAAGQAVYSTYVGGSDDDKLVDSLQFTTDSSGNAFLIGETSSQDFPTTEGAFQRAYGGGGDLFVTKLDAGGRVLYSTYVGGSKPEGGTLKIAASGNAYVFGSTESPDFPTTQGAFQRALGSEKDLFVMEMDGSGAVVYSTCLGSRSDIGSFELDASENVYVVGETKSSNFRTEAAFQKEFGGVSDLFVTKLDASGAAIYSTYLGGEGAEVFKNVFLQVDASGNVCVAGMTASSHFPTEGAFQPKFGGGDDDVFVTRLDAAGAAIYSTYLGGNDLESLGGFEVDASGNVYATGTTDSRDFPTTQGAFQRTFGGIRDEFVTKLDTSGAAVYSTYLGGSAGLDTGLLKVDSSGNAYVAGHTLSPDFPTTPGAFQSKSGGAIDIFSTKLSANGSAVYSTLLGGSGEELMQSFDIDASGNVYLFGSVDSQDFPTRFPVQPVNGGFFFSDGFAASLSPTGSLLYSTYLGGGGLDFIKKGVLDSSGDVLILGETGSPDFPVTAGAFRPEISRGFNTFLAKIGPSKETGALRIIGVSLIRRILYVIGEDFDHGAEILLEGQKQNTRLKSRDQTVLISKQAGKKIRRGQTVTLRVRTSDGRLSDSFSFTRLR